MSTKKSSIILVTFLFFFTVSVYAVPMPVGIGGIVKNNDSIFQNCEITIENLDTGETKTKTTNNNGLYACALDGQTGDTIKITTICEGNVYSNTCIVDTSKSTQWLNLSFFCSSDDTDTDDNPSDGGDTPNPPPASPSIEIGFTYSPEYPVVNQTIVFSDTSQGDIISYGWEIDGKTFDTENLVYSFTEIGNYIVTHTISDNSKTISCSQTIPVSKNNSEEPIESHDDEPENISISINVKDNENNTYQDVKIDIYQNNTHITTVYTDINGSASINLPKGDYTFKTEDETKDLSFNNDGRVTFMYDNSDDGGTQPTVNQKTGFPWLYLIAIIAVIGIVLFFVAYYNRWIL